MKSTKTIDTIRTFTVVGALTVVLTGLGLLQVAAAGIALAGAAPLRRLKKTVLTQPPILTLPTRRSDIGLREAA